MTLGRAIARRKSRRHPKVQTPYVRTLDEVESNAITAVAPIVFLVDGILRDAYGGQ